MSLLETTFYVAGKVKHAPMWRMFRDEQNVNIISSWIDKTQVEVPDDDLLRDIAVSCVEEPKQADVFVLYAEEGDHLKYSLIEMGVALAMGKKVCIVGNCESVSQTNRLHPAVERFTTVDEVFEKYKDRDNIK